VWQANFTAGQFLFRLFQAPRHRSNRMPVDPFLLTRQRLYLIAGLMDVESGLDLDDAVAHRTHAFSCRARWHELVWGGTVAFYARCFGSRGAERGHALQVEGEGELS
jgi:hypothetical protein